MALQKLWKDRRRHVQTAATCEDNRLAKELSRSTTGTGHCRTKPVQYYELIPLSNEPSDSLNLFCPVLSSTLQPIKTPSNPTKKQGKLTLKTRMQGYFFSLMIHI